MIRILHLSDLHYGVARGAATCPHHFAARGTADSTALASIILRDQTIRRPPDIVVTTGDIVWTGIAEEYRLAAEFYKQLMDAWPGTRHIIIPGNHDHDRAAEPETSQAAFAEFLQQLPNLVSRPRPKTNGRLSTRESLFFYESLSLEQIGDIEIVGVNSAAYVAGLGTPVFVAPEVLGELDALLVGDGSNKLRIFAIHHHVLPFVDWVHESGDRMAALANPDPTIVANSAALQTWLGKRKFRLVLHGHKHRWHARRDDLRQTSDANGSDVIVLGAGSAGVVEGHRAHMEPLSYNLVSAWKRTRQQYEIQVDARRITDYAAVSEADNGPECSFLIGDARVGTTAFDTETTSECYAAIQRCAAKTKKITSFWCHVSNAKYEHPQCDVPMDKVLRSFTALHPEHALTEKWRNIDGLRDRVGEISQAYQFQHGLRLFKRIEAGGGSISPIEAALQRLKESESQGYVALFSQAIDVLSSECKPLPALLSLQFIRDNARLNLVATFRKLELSFWWLVNMYECSELLTWAAAKDERTPGGITFFSPIAEWRPENPEPALVAEIDVMQLELIIRKVRLAGSGDAEELRGIAGLLADKLDATNARNLVPDGLTRLGAVIRGMDLRAGNRLGSVGDQLLQAAEHIRNAARPGQTDHSFLEKAREALQRALTTLQD